MAQQTGNGNQGESGGSRSRTYSAAEFQTLARKRVEEALGSRAIPGTEMSGVLGPFSDGKAYSSAIYEIKLLDLDPAETSYVELVIPRKNSSPGARSLEEQAQFLENRPVKVRGDVQTNTYNGRISFRLYVRQITDFDNAEQQSHNGHTERERSLLSVLSNYRRFGQDTPQRSRPGGAFKVCVIHPASGQVHNDFMGRISRLGSNLLETERMPVSFHDPVAIGQAISRTDADIVALVRGGGDATEFRALNDPELIRQWMNADAYTVSGLGHAEDATLLDLVSDKSTSTPTAAGDHVRQAIFRGVDLSGKQNPGSAPARNSQDESKSWKAWAWVWAILFLLTVALIVAFINNLPPSVFEETLRTMFQ